MTQIIQGGIIRQIQGHEMIKRQKLISTPVTQLARDTILTSNLSNLTPTGNELIRCGQCTFSHKDPNEVERHRNEFIHCRYNSKIDGKCGRGAHFSLLLGQKFWLESP